MDVLQTWPPPKSLLELRRFLGLIGYYRNFVKGYGLIAWPLTSLLKKETFMWNLAANEAFNLLKQVMVTTLVLAHLYFCVENICFWARSVGGTNVIMKLMVI